MPYARRKWFYIAISLIGWSLLETCSWFSLNAVTRRGYDQILYYDFDSMLEGISQKNIDGFRKFNFDRLLGSDVTKGMSHTSLNTAGVLWTENVEKTGERRNPFHSPRTVISAYGDSFTYCHEVNDNETWPFYLSELSGTNVINYGSGGHGPDQSLLKMQRNIKNGMKTPIVILSIWNGSLNRLLSAYRPFFHPNPSDTLVFKPMLVKNGSSFEWRNIPLKKIRSEQHVRAALQEAKKYDFWYRLRKVKKTFPYSINLLRLGYYASMGRHKVHERPCQNQEIKARVLFLLSNLKYNSRKHDYTAVVLFIPMPSELRTRMIGGKCGCSSFIEEVQALSTKNFVVVNVCEKKFDESRFFIKEFEGHASPYGNRVIAETVFDKIRAITTLSHRSN